MGFREAPGRKNGWGVRSRQLPQRSAFQDLASEKGRVSVLNEKNIREASSQELSKSRAQTTPLSAASLWLLVARSRLFCC